MVNRDTHTGPSFSLKNRLARLIWDLFYILLFRFSPKPFHGWRAILLRIFGARIGRGVHIYPGVKIWAPWNLEIADQAGVASNAILYSQALIKIGKKAVISQGAHICAGTHDYETPGFPLVTKPIIIKDYAWVAAEAFIHPGIVIGEGAVIGARSVVVSDIPAWKIAVGFPCKVLKERLSNISPEEFKNQLDT